MTKEKSNPTDTKSTNKDTSKKPVSKTQKDNTQPESSLDETSTNENKPEPSSAKKTPHVRGESQKPVTNAYRTNWNSIFKRE